jgi:glycosyltransferase involved in cell wall biosynthesis
MGSMIPTKGPQLLVEAFARLPAGAASLHLVGPRPAQDLDPDFAARLVARVAELPGASIEGAFEPGEAQARLDAADVLVLPSLWEENSPLVLREASAAGLRVVASRRGGVAELLPDARLFEPTRPNELLRGLAAELRAGRCRRQPVAWDGPVEHAGHVLAWYHRCLAHH